MPTTRNPAIFPRSHNLWKPTTDSLSTFPLGFKLWRLRRLEPFFSGNVAAKATRNRELSKSLFEKLKLGNGGRQAMILPLRSKKPATSWLQEDIYEVPYLTEPKASRAIPDTYSIRDDAKVVSFEKRHPMHSISLTKGVGRQLFYAQLAWNRTRHVSRISIEWHNILMTISVLSDSSN